MALTKQELQQFGDIVSSTLENKLNKKLNPIKSRLDTTVTKDDLDKKLKPIEKRLSSVENQMATKDDLKEGISALSQLINRGFEDQKNLIENTYASKDELEELKNDVYELREKVEALQQQIAPA